MTPLNSIQPFLDAIEAQQRQGAISPTAHIKPELIEAAMSVLPGYRKVFAPLTPQTETAPIYDIYDQMRKEGDTEHSVLIFVECETISEFRQALDQLPVRSPSEWRALSMGGCEKHD